MKHSKRIKVLGLFLFLPISPLPMSSLSAGCASGVAEFELIQEKETELKISWSSSVQVNQECTMNLFCSRIGDTKMNNIVSAFQKLAIA